MIRPAVTGDVGAIVEIERVCFGTLAWSDGLVLAEVDGRHRTTLVDSTDGRIDAWASVSVVGDAADLMRVAVLPEARRRSVARALLDLHLELAAAAGAARMLLEVAHDNVAAIALYESSGFVEVSRRRDYYADGADSLVMERPLP